MTTRLLLTRRALEMLGADPATYAGQPAAALIEIHPLVAAFVRKRSQAPDSGETPRGLSTRATARNLHAGRARGLTWHDRTHDICWMLGGGDTHAAGERRDIYRELIALDAAGLLFPTERDYLDAEEALEPSDEVIAELRTARDSLVEKARQRPGHEIRRMFGKDVLGVGILVDVIVETVIHAEMIYFGITLPEDDAVYNAAFPDVFAALLPDEADLDDVAYPAAFPHRQLVAREFLFRWDHYLDDP